VPRFFQSRQRKKRGCGRGHLMGAPTMIRQAPKWGESR
jgi:hypothetical protein